MDIYLLSSLSEGTSMTLLEAMSIDKPCVVTNAGGNPEIIINDKNGLVTKNDNTEDFVQAIVTLLSSPELLSQYGKSGTNIFNQLFSEKVMNNNFSSLYQSKAR
jgi:glycosyltransferase involved in cell wall biosynthesis